MTVGLTAKAAVVALAAVLANPVDAKTISFTGLFEAENFVGFEYPLAEQPATLEVIIDIDETTAPDVAADNGLGDTSAHYYAAVTSFTYEAFGIGGNTLGTWSVPDVELQISSLNVMDIVVFQSDAAMGPGPLDRLLVMFEGDANLLSGSGLEMLATGTLGAMTTGEFYILQDQENAQAIGMQFLIDFDSIAVLDDPSSGGGSPAAVPLPASLPLLLAGFGALGLVKPRRRWS